MTDYAQDVIDLKKSSVRLSDALRDKNTSLAQTHYDRCTVALYAIGDHLDELHAKPQPVHAGNWLESAPWGKFAILLTLLVMLFAVLGCATVSDQKRYFTEAEDADIRAKCEQTGCVFVPAPLWQQILKRLQGQWI